MLFDLRRALFLWARRTRFGRRALLKASKGLSCRDSRTWSGIPSLALRSLMADSAELGGSAVLLQGSFAKLRVHQLAILSRPFVWSLFDSKRTLPLPGSFAKIRVFDWSCFHEVRVTVAILSYLWMMASFAGVGRLFKKVHYWFLIYCLFHKNKTFLQKSFGIKANCN